MTEQEFDNLMGLMITTSDFSFQALEEICKLDEEGVIAVKQYLRENSKNLEENSTMSINEVIVSQISNLDLLVIKELRNLAQVLESEKSSLFYVNGDAEKKLAEWYLYLKAMNMVKKVEPIMLYRLKNYHKLTPFDAWQSINCKNEFEISYSEFESAIRFVCCETFENAMQMPENKKIVLIKMLQEVYDKLQNTRLFYGNEMTQDLENEIKKINVDIPDIGKYFKPFNE